MSNTQPPADNMELYREILNDTEISKIVAFCQDTITFEAVKKCVLFYVYYQGIAKKGKPFDGSRNYAFQLAWNRKSLPRSDAELGADLRALVRGTEAVDSGFTELKSIKQKTGETVVEDVNPAM
jgi:hypothetical protein